MAGRACRSCPQKRVTKWVGVELRAGVRPPTIAAKMQAVKTMNLNQLVEAARRKRQELLLTPTTQTSNRWPNPRRGRWTAWRWTPRAGESSYSLPCLPPNGSRPFVRVPVKLEEYPCRLLLDSSTAKSLVNA